MVKSHLLAGPQPCEITLGQWFTVKERMRSMASDKQRCAWVNSPDPIYAEYHDTEWGVPEYDSRALWEKLMLDGFQAGLAWITILRKRETMRAAFDGFDPDIIARYDDDDRARLLADPGIIRSRLKIEAAISNAQAYLDMRDAGTDFSTYLWSFVDGAPIQNAFAALGDIPTQTPVSLALSKDLKKRGFKFVGPVIVYAFMEAVRCVPFFLNRAISSVVARALPAKVSTEDLPRRLYHRRNKLRLTKVELAKIIGVTPAIIRQWEQGEHAPSAKHVPAVVEFLGTDDWIPADTISQYLTRSRFLRGWSQQRMALWLGCGETSLREWEAGRPLSRRMRDKIFKAIAASPLATG
jgi:DNA-3-methyladenine glycosylase I